MEKHKFVRSEIHTFCDECTFVEDDPIHQPEGQQEFGINIKVPDGKEKDELVRRIANAQTKEEAIAIARQAESFWNSLGTFEDWWERTYRKELSSKRGMRRYLELQKMARSAWDARAAIAEVEGKGE